MSAKYSGSFTMEFFYHHCNSLCLAPKNTVSQVDVGWATTPALLLPWAQGACPDHTFPKQQEADKTKSK